MPLEGRVSWFVWKEKYINMKILRNSFRKHAYSNILKTFATKKWKKKIQIKNSHSLHISAQNIDCGYSLEPPWQGGSNEYPQSMFFWAEIRKNNVYPCKPQFYFIKMGFNWVKMMWVPLYLCIFLLKQRIWHISELFAVGASNEYPQHNICVLL